LRPSVALAEGRNINETRRTNIQRIIAFLRYTIN